MSEETRREIFKRFEEIASLFGREIDLVEVEEFARELGEAIARRVPGPERLVTRTIDRDNVLIRGSEDLIDSRVRGRLRELVLKSSSPDFRITIMRDGRRLLDRTFSELMEISQYSETIDAFQEAEGGSYVLKLSNISWLNDFLLTISATETTFDKIFTVWEERI